jgi:LytS/YehU family sensor histidine kinase
MDSPMPLQNKMTQLGRGPSLLFGFMSSLGILFISTIFWMITETKRRQQRELSLINENLTTEMKFLKSQINPHFLFNALNNVYSLSHLNSKKTPEMILKLSDMLRFMLYDSEDKKVPIGKEIDYIKHFIDFQKLKIEGEPRIAIDIEQSDLTVMIEPMLLIPFIENAFKHSKIEDVRNSWLSIDLKTTSSTIHFKVCNSLPASSIKVDSIGGIGLENVRKRLQFLYPKRHRLEILNTDNSFNVDLTIDIKRENTDK